MTSEAAHLRALLSTRPLRPYERLSSDLGVEARQAAEEILESGWRVGTRPPVPVRPPIDWATLLADHRSHHFHLHSWDFLEPALRAIDDGQAPDELIHFVVAVAHDWAARHPDFDPGAGMAWYDMAIGLRALRLAYIVDLTVRFGLDDRLPALIHSADQHRLALLREDIFKPGHNHGVFVAAGQAALGRRLSGVAGMADAERQGRERLVTMLETQFGRDGVHVEHSPGYHLMILDVIRGLWEAGLLPPSERDRLVSIEDALAWFTLPDGSLAPMGDTERALDLPEEGIVASDHLRWVASGGRTGGVPQESWRLFEDSGYAVLKDGWIGDGNSEPSYLLHSAAFHSRAHKHADDQSVIWFDRGEEILTDPGRFAYLDPGGPTSELGKLGFFYQDPRRVYTEETRAHTTIEIDGAAYRRRGVKPYGSGIRSAGPVAGLMHSDAVVEHQTLYDQVRIRHRRVVVLDPGLWLLVIDQLDPADASEHRYAQWFQFAPQVDVVSDDLGWRATLARGDRLWTVPLTTPDAREHHRGRTEPSLQGWVAADPDTLEPATSVAAVRTAAGPVTMAMVLAFSPDASTPLPMVDATSVDGIFEWIAFDRVHRLHVGAEPGTIDYELA